MKINTKKIPGLSLFRKPTAFLRRIGHDAYTDWGVTFLLAFILMVFLVAIAFMAYNGSSILTSSNDVPKNTSVVAAFDIKALNNVLDIYKARDAERQRLESGYSGPSDPSM